MNKEVSLKDIPRLINSIDRKKVGIVVMIVYAIVILIISVFHEPWFDETQAYLIARDASYSDILFYLPHYECHPPLWHLILSVPAKIGVPFEITIKSIQFLTALFMVFMLEFKSPFNNLVRIFLPFTYFMAYQYGVVARPYAMMLGALFLVAALWKRRNECPWKFVLALLFLCLTSAYGIVIAGGITVAWVAESRDLLKNRRRLIALITLLFVASALIVEIFPAKDNIVPSSEGSALIKKILLVYFVYPSEALFTDLIFNNGEVFLWQYVIATIISVLLLVVACYIAYKKKVLHYLLISFVCFSIVSGKYFKDHHLGIYIGIFVFVFWIGIENNKEHIGNVFHIIANAMAGVSIVISLIWGIASCLNDFIYQYANSRITRDYISANDFENYSWAGPWYITDSGIAFQSATGSVVEVEGYFPDTAFINNPGDVSYQVLKYMTDEEKEIYLNKVKSNPQPDFMISQSDAMVNKYAEYLNYSENYRFVNGFINQKIYKTRIINNGINIFARQGIVDELNIPVIE